MNESNEREENERPAANSADAPGATQVAGALPPPDDARAEADADSPAETATETPQPTERRPVSMVGILALLIALSASGGAWWLWQQLTALNISQSAVSSANARELAALTQSLDAQRRQLGALETELAQQQLAATNAMEQLRASMGRDRQAWRLAEVEYLLNIANRQLQLLGDTNMARRALQDGDAILNALNDPQLLPIRQQLAREITALAGVAQPDITGLALALGAISEGVRVLPLAGPYRKVAPEDASAAEPMGDTDDWRVAVGRAWQEMRGLVSVRRSESNDRALLPPEQQLFLRENLRLKIESVRLALLRGEEAVMQTAADEANRWLQRYFDQQDKAVRHASGEMAKLHTLVLRPQLPDISGSLQAVRKALGAAGADR